MTARWGSSVLMAAVAAVLSGAVSLRAAEPVASSDLFEITEQAVEVRVPKRGVWLAPRPVSLPDSYDNSAVLMLLQPEIPGESQFGGVREITSSDKGKTWRTIRDIEELELKGDDFDDAETVIGLTPGRHRRSRKVIALGQTARGTARDMLDERATQQAVYTIMDSFGGKWSAPVPIDMPNADRFRSVGFTGQWVAEREGTILTPVRYAQAHELAMDTAKTAVVRCAFDGKTLRVLAVGTELSGNAPTGLRNPSLTFFGNDYFLVAAGPDSAVVSSCRDGLNFAGFRPLVFDDARPLNPGDAGVVWAAHSDRLFAVYSKTAKGFRATTEPLGGGIFMAELDTRSMKLRKSTEIALTPKLKNPVTAMAAADMNEDETWITLVDGTDRDGFRFLRIRWKKPNKLFDR